MDVQLAVDGAPEVVVAIGSALQRRRRLRIRYVDASDTTTEREVDPLARQLDADYAKGRRQR